jgi:hypothetical protein
LARILAGNLEHKSVLHQKTDLLVVVGGAVFGYMVWLYRSPKSQKLPSLLKRTIIYTQNVGYQEKEEPKNRPKAEQKQSAMAKTEQTKRHVCGLLNNRAKKISNLRCFFVFFD